MSGEFVKGAGTGASILCLWHFEDGVVERLTFTIDGQNFATLDEFYEEVGRVLIPGQRWGKNLDAFIEILSWPFNKERRPYTLIWKNSAISKARLGHAELARKLESMISSCHPAAIPSVHARLQQAREGKGPTLFDWLVEMMQKSQEHVELRLA